MKGDDKDLAAHFTIIRQQEGARWAMEHLPVEYSALISSALACYQTDQEMVIEEENARVFADEMLAEIEKEI